MKKYFLLLTLALASCTQFVEDPNPVMENDGLTAMTIVAKGTKTTLQNDLSVIWNDGDSVCVFDNLGCHPFVTSETGASVKFNGKASADKEPKLVLYPYDKYASAQLETSEIKTFIPGIQTGRIGSFGEVNNISVGIVEDDAFYARNVCGLIKLTLSRSDLASVEIISPDACNKVAGGGRRKPSFS